MWIKEKVVWNAVSFLKSTMQPPEFGSRVACLVESCSEPAELKDDSWRERQEAFLGNLADAPPDSLLVIAAGKPHNLICLLDDHRIFEYSIFDQFNGGKTGTLWYYGLLADTLAPSVPTSLAFRLTEAPRALQAVA